VETENKMPKIVKAGVVDIMGLEDPSKVIAAIEHCGRVAYASWEREAPGTAERFVRMIVKLGHESVLEHRTVTAILKCDRATAQQLTRHRIASFTMQSQRYVSYAHDRFGGEIEFVDPEHEGPSKAEFYDRWLKQVGAAEEAYMDLMKLPGVKPEDARSVLPNSTATVVAISANLREWRHIFKVRTEEHAQHNIRCLMGGLLDAFAEKLPCVFADMQTV
jgi:thymidylate synthase (FAD)